jgi:hypothetical protein
MYMEACGEINVNRIIELWDNFIEDMRQQEIECHIRSPRINGDNGNGRQEE